MNILCPTDFSDNSCFAVEYAINLTNIIGGRLHFLTTYTVPRATGSFRKFDVEIRETVVDELEKFTAQYLPLIKSKDNPVIAVVEGSPGDEILHYAKKHNIDLIIMGTQGSSDMRTVLFGSVTKKVFENTKVPVLAIPAVTREVLTGNRILLSLDDKEVEDKKLFDILKFLIEKLGTKLDIIHVSGLDNYVAFSNKTTSYLSDVTENMVELHSDDPVLAIRQYVENSDVGILVMVRRHHSFWERLFVQTNTTAELFASNVPILMLPE